MRCAVQGSKERYLRRSLRRRSSLATIRKSHTRVLSTSLPIILSTTTGTTTMGTTTIGTTTMARSTSLPLVMGDQEQEAREDLGLYDKGEEFQGEEIEGDEIQGEQIEVKEGFEEESFLVLGKAVLKVPDMAEEDDGNDDDADEEDYEEDSDEFDDEFDSDDSELYAEDSDSDEENSDLREWREEEARRRRQEGMGMLEALEQEERRLMRLKLEEMERMAMEKEMEEEELLGHHGDSEEEEEEVVRVRNQFDVLLDDSEEEEEEEEGEEEWRGTFRREEVVRLQEQLQAAPHDSSMEDSGLEDSGEEGERSSERERQARVLACGPQELWRHIQEFGLGLISRPPTRSDGNCWYDAIADQVELHGVPGVPREHGALRKFLVEALPRLDQAAQWAETVFGGLEVLEEFLAVHSTPGQWTDELGIMCQATALIVGREIRLVGTANIGQLGPGYTVLESVPGAERLQPLTVGYYQDRHYQSLAEAPWPRADSGLGGELREVLESTELREALGEQEPEELETKEEIGVEEELEELEELSRPLNLPSTLRLTRASSSSPLAHITSPKPTNLSPLAHLSTSNPAYSSPLVHLSSPKPRLSSSSSPLERLASPLANPRGLLSNLMV